MGVKALQTLLSLPHALCWQVLLHVGLHTAVALGMCPAGLGCDDPRAAVSTGAELRSKPGTAPAILAEVLRVLMGDTWC